MPYANSTTRSIYNRLDKLYRDLRRTRTDYSTICPKQRERHVVNRIEESLGRDISSLSAIFRAENEATDLMADFVFRL